MILYVITTHAHLPGVGLAKRGHWGGIRYDSDAAAELAAKDDAKGEPFRIQRDTVSKIHALKI